MTDDSRQQLGAMLARTLDSVGDRKVLRAVVVYEVEEEDGDLNVIGYDATDGVTWTDHIGLFRQAQIHAEAVVLAAHLESGDDE